jgi:hypothetical protein
MLGEKGDQTQIATVAPAARYADMVQGILEATFGTMLASALLRAEPRQGVSYRRTAGGDHWP